jgi:hypothetical protein
MLEADDALRIMRLYCCTVQASITRIGKIWPINVEPISMPLGGFALFYWSSAPARLEIPGWRSINWLILSLDSFLNSNQLD